MLSPVTGEQDLEGFGSGGGTPLGYFIFCIIAPASGTSAEAPHWLHTTSLSKANS